MSRIPIQTIQPRGVANPLAGVGQGLQQAGASVQQAFMAEQQALLQFEQKAIDAQRARDAVDLEMWAFETVGNARVQMSQLNDPAAIAELSASTSETITNRLRGIDDPQLQDRVRRAFMQQASDFRVEAVQRQAKAENIQSLAAMQRFGDTLSQNIGDGAIDFDQAIDIFTESVDELLAAGTINEMAREELLTRTRSDLAARHVTRLIVDELPGEALSQLQDAGVRAALSAAQLSTLTSAARSEQVRQVMESINQHVYDGGIEAIREQIDGLLEEGAIDAGTALRLRGQIEQAERQQAAVMQQATVDATLDLLETNNFAAAETLAQTVQSPRERRQLMATVASDAAEYTNKQLDVVASDLRQRIAVATDASQIISAFASMNEASEQILSVMPESMQDGIRKTMREQHAQMVKDAANAIGTTEDVGMAMAVKASLEQFPDMATPESVKAAQQAVDETTRRAEANQRARTQATLHLQEMSATGQLSRDRVYTQSVVNAMDEQATIAGTRDQLLRELSNISGAPMPASFRRAVTDAYNSSDVAEIRRLQEIVGFRTVRLNTNRRAANPFMDGIMRINDTAMPDAANQIETAAANLNAAVIQQRAAEAESQWRRLNTENKRRAALGIAGENGGLLWQRAELTPTQHAAMKEAFVVANVLGVEPQDVFATMYVPIGRGSLIHSGDRSPDSSVARRRANVGPRLDWDFRVTRYRPARIEATQAAINSFDAAFHLNRNAQPGDAVGLSDGGIAMPIRGDFGAPVGYTIIRPNGTITQSTQVADPQFGEASRILERRSDPAIRNSNPLSGMYEGNGTQGFLDANGDEAWSDLYDATMRFLQQKGRRLLGDTPTPEEAREMENIMLQMVQELGYTGI